MFLNAAMRWRGCRSWAPRPKIAVVILGGFASGGMPGWRTPSTFSRALNSACVTRVVSAVTSERSSTVTAFLPASAATSSASGNGCSSLTEMTPTFLPCARRCVATAWTSSVTEPRPIMTVSASSHM